MSGSSRSCSAKEDEQEPRVTPGQNVSSLTGIPLDCPSRQEGQDGHSGGSYQQSSENETNMRWQITAEVTSTQELQPTSAGDKLPVHLMHSSAKTSCSAEMRHPGPRAECEWGSQVRLVRATKAYQCPQGLPLHRDPLDPLFFFFFFSFNAKYIASGMYL